MVECIYQVHSEVKVSLSFLISEEGPREVLRKRKVEKLLPRRANIQRAGRISQLSFDRPHKRSWIDKWFATVTDRTIVFPQRILQRHTRNDVRSHNAIKENTTQSVGICYERKNGVPPGIRKAPAMIHP